MCSDEPRQNARLQHNEQLRLHELVGRPDLRVVAARMREIDPHLRGTSGSALYQKFTAGRPPVRPYSSDFVRVFVQACYDCYTGKDPEPPADRCGSPARWEAWTNALADGRVDEPSPLPPRRGPRAASPEEIERKETAARERARVLTGGGLPATLRTIYPNYPLVELAVTAMPICVFPAPPDQWDDIEAPLGTPGSPDVPGLDDYSAAFDRSGLDTFRAAVERYRKADPDDRRHFFSGATYALDEIVLDAHDRSPTLNCTTGRYFTSMATSECLDAELMRALAADPDQEVPLGKLDHRSWLHENVSRTNPAADPVIDGRYRAAAVSHAAVVMLANDRGGYDILLPSRSDEVATHARFRHVAPSGIFAPLNVDSPSPSGEFSVRGNFYREWVEELYSAKEYEGWELDRFRTQDVADPATEPEISRLLEVIDPDSPTKRGDLYYTGVSVNLLTLRPEICLLLVIDDPTWLTTEKREAEAIGRPFSLSWEYISSSGQLDRSQRLTVGADLQLLPADGVPLSPGSLVPNAAAAIHLALQVMARRTPAGRDASPGR
jgi:hypothetical protein